VSTEENRDLVSREQNALQSAQRPQASMLGLFNLTYESAKLFFQLGNGNITHDNELWDGDHYVLLLSGYSRHLETNAKVIFLSLKYLIYFEIFSR